MKTVKIKVTGRVQGVLFRANTRGYCDKVGIKGWVRNEDDGSVLIVASGSQEKLEGLVSWIRESPGASKVEDVRVSKIKEGRFEGFEVRRDGGFISDKGKAAKNLVKRIIS